MLTLNLCYLDIRWHHISYHLPQSLRTVMHDRSKLLHFTTEPLLYLSTFFQSKLRLMTTGGTTEAASDGGVVLDRQGEVSTQHRPSAKSENTRAHKLIKKHRTNHA